MNLKQIGSRGGRASQTPPLDPPLGHVWSIVNDLKAPFFNLYKKYYMHKQPHEQKAHIQKRWAKGLRKWNN